MKRAYHCGFIDEDEWHAEYGGPMFLGAPPHHVDLVNYPNGEPRPKVYCPGYLARLPVVQEAWRAYDARKDGLLPVLYPRTELVILEATDEVMRAIRRHENSQHKKFKSTNPR